AALIACLHCRREGREGLEGQEGEGELGGEGEKAPPPHLPPFLPPPHCPPLPSFPAGRTLHNVRHGPFLFARRSLGSLALHALWGDRGVREPLRGRSQVSPARRRPHGRRNRPSHR